MTKEDLLKKVKDEHINNDYTLIRNKNAANKEYMLLKKEHVQSAKKYYPQKEFEIILKDDNLKNILDKLEEMKPTDYDVIFIDNFEIEEFYLIEQYVLTFTGIRSTIIDSRCREKEKKAPQKALEKVKQDIDDAKGSYKISSFDELILDKSLEEVKEYAKEKNIEYIDLYEVFDGRKELFADGVHPNPQGSKLLAQTVYEVIAK